MSPSFIEPIAIKRARALRRDMTDGERKLWSELRDFRRLYGIHVRKQVPIGPFIADFAIHSKILIIEVDGEHHFTPDGMTRAGRRDAWFASQGYKTIRMTTGELSDSIDGCVEDFAGVGADGMKSLFDGRFAPTPTPNPSPQGGGERLRPRPIQTGLH